MKARIPRIILLLPALSFLYLLHFSFKIPTNLFEIIIYLVAIASFITSQKSWKLSSKEQLFALVVLVLCIIGTVVSPHRTEALGIVKGWVVPALLMAKMLSFTIKYREDVKLLIRGMMWQGAGVAAVAIVQQIPAVAEWWSRQAPDLGQYLLNHRSTSIFNSPNSAAMLLVPAIIISRFATKGWERFAWYLVLAIGLIATGSQAGLLAAVIGLVLQDLVEKKRLKFAYGLGLVSLLLVNPIVLSLVAMRNPNNEDIRVHIWHTAWKLITNHPILGNGLTSFHDVFQAATLHQPNFDEFITPYALHPHNIFLYTWFLFGIVGLLVLIFVIVRAFAISLKQQRPHQLLAAVLLLAFIVHGMVDNNLWKNDTIIWFTAIIMLCYIGKLEARE